MIICISGSHGEGKTTLLEKYTSQYDDVKWLKNTASRESLRELNMTLSEVYSSKHQITVFQNLVFEKHCHIIDLANSSDELYITERSCYDLLAYATLGVGGDTNYQEWLDEYASNCLYAHEMTAGLVHLEGRMTPLTGENPENDGTRPVGKMFTEATCAIISHMVHQTNTVPTSMIYNPDLDIRVESLHNFINVIRGKV